MALIQNPLVAQRSLIASKALVDLPNLAVVSVSGAERLEWLHSLLSANLRSLQPGVTAQALLLDANGRIESMLFLQDDGEQTRIVVEREQSAGLIAFLSKMIFRSKVAVQDTTDAFAIIGSWGVPLAGAVATLTDNWHDTVAGGYRYGAAPSEPWSLQLNLVTPEQRAALQSDSSTDWAGVDALDALRIAAHRPALAELDEKTIPHELDLLATAVHLSKGCYRGQETVAKVHNLGHPPRRLTMLHLDGSNHLLPLPGAVVEVAGEARGRVTSAANHHEMGPIALAVLSRNVDPEAQLIVVGDHEPIAATQEIIVPVDAGKIANVPRPSLLGKTR
jgi:folate-binding protein YgfZ